MTRPITKKQQAVLDFIKAHASERGFMPTVSEIANEFRWKSGNSAQDHLDALHVKGYIKLARGKARAIQIVGCNDKAAVNGMASALRIISTWASYDHEKGVRLALDPKQVLYLCNKALGIEPSARPE